MTRSHETRHRKKHPRPEVELKVVFITFFAASFLLLINFQLDLAGLWSLSSKLGSARGALQTLEETRALLIEKFVMTTVIGVPLTILIGLLYSFRFGSPIRRFRKYFQDVGAGRWDARCRLRKGDALQDLCRAINDSMDSVSARLREDLTLLREAGALLDPAAPEQGGSLERRRALAERIATAVTLQEERLGLRPARPDRAPPVEPPPATRSPERELEPTA